MENHSIRDYAKLIRLGFAGLREEIIGQLQRCHPADPAYPCRENFWRAALDVCEAGITLGRRYASLAAEKAAETADPDERVRLEQMAAVCRQVPERGARNFREAVQALWFGHILTCGEDGINANSIGRLDQILYPYYHRDAETGCITREEAVELMAELACKLYLEYDVQAITLGGVTAAGAEAANELTAVILDATEQVGFVRDLSVRLHRGSPPWLIQRAAELIARGGGIPFLFNDDCFIPALTERGIALADARDYAPIGCVELTIPGKANPRAVSGWFYLAKCLELALFDGCDPRSGAQLGPKTGTLAEHANFDSFYGAYLAQVSFFAERMVYHCNRGELAQRERGPLPCWSLLTDDCLARGRDITAGGALYDYHSICCIGIPDTADALAAIRQLVFSERRIDAQRLLESLRANFTGCEDLRRLLLDGAPKYGNDNSEVDELAAKAAGDFISLMDRFRSPSGGRYVVHLFSFYANIAAGKAVGALPDGRRQGEPLAYSLSAHQGRDQEGVTAFLCSLAQLPHRRAAGGSAAIIDIDPALIANGDGSGCLQPLITAALDMGVGQMQWNVVTAERLRQAQRDPEHYGNLAVRVAGFSQMFRLLNLPLQEHVIARTKHRN